MKKQKILKIWNNYYVQLFIAFLLTLLLISVAILFIEEINLDNTILIYNIFGTLALVAFISGYNSTKKGMKTQLEFGITRKKIYINHILDTLVIVTVSIALVFYYMYVYIRAIHSNLYFFASHFNVPGMIFLPLTFLFTAAAGFTFGIVQIKAKTFYPLFVIAVTGLIFIAIKYSYMYMINIILAVLILIIGFINYLLVNNYCIKEK